MVDSVAGHGSVRVAIVGAGWAGCAAGVTLAASGVSVTLFEKARTLGGRARRVAHGDMALDNGQHLVIGAYRQTLDLVSLVHSVDRVANLFERFPLTLRPFGAPRPGAVTFTAWKTRAPAHIAGGLFSARGLGIAERVALAIGFRRLAHAGFRSPPSQTVTQYFADTPKHAFTAIWAPLCLAALNTPPARASAQMFADVLRATFTGPASHSDFLVPAVDLSTCFPEAAARYIADRGGTVRPGIGVRAITHGDDGVALDAGAGIEAFDAAIVAVGPHQLAATIGMAAEGNIAWRATIAQVNEFAYESITTVYLGFAAPVPLAAPVMRLDDAPGHWAFDRSVLLGRNVGPDGGLARSSPVRAASLIAVVISAGGPHDMLDQRALAHQVEAQMRRLAPHLPAVLWSRVIAERRATYSCTPALVRPRAGRVSPGIYLAGDYTDADFPATLEAATRSGVTAARALIDDRSRPSQPAR